MVDYNSKMTSGHGEMPLTRLYAHGAILHSTVTKSSTPQSSQDADVQRVSVENEV